MGALLDGQAIPAQTELTARVCVVGAGPAGLAVSEELARRGIDVLVVESSEGPLDLKAASLNQGEVLGHAYDLSESRARGIGGSANAWDLDLAGMAGARYRELDREDFDDDGGLRGVGWPFGMDELAPYYAQARIRAGLGASAGWVPPAPDPDSARLGRDPFQPVWFDYGPASVFTREKGVAGGRARIVTGATAIEIVKEAPGERSVSAVRLGSFDGGTFTVRADVFVLAAGGIENPRLLLASTPAGERHALGNASDLVGRYFMEHWHVWGGVAELSPGSSLSPPTTAFSGAGGRLVRRKFAMTPTTRNRRGLLNSAVMLTPKAWSPTLGYRLLEGAVPDAVLRLRREIGSGSKSRPGKPSDLAPAGWWAVRKLWWRAAGRRRSTWRSTRGYRFFEMYHFAEQEPLYTNRVELIDEVDELGMRLMDPALRKARLTWRMSPLDARTIREAQAAVSRQLGRIGARAVGSRLGATGPIPGARGGFHHMGTTRMAESPERGVVDAECRVHGLSNLYVAGSSVFPTGGFSNPTLTVIAISYRLADHLVRRLSDVPVVTARS